MSEQDVYVTGYSGDYFAGTATVWKNGDEIQLSSKRSHANDICIVDNKIYIVGEENNNAVLWIDGKIQVLSSDKSVAYSIAVSNNNIYVSGIGGFDPVGRPVYGVWKNGIRQFISSEMRDEIKAVKINNDKVYLSGSSVNKIPLWIADIN